ncbi:MAG TPA: PspA/IM30 family protein [Pirellulaceae bacterium]|nr:PspA/IM30 family protein [Pirellulaceae bacterium]
MGIFKRMQDIISANLNDMVEDYEDPEQMLRQAIREMESAVSKAKPDVAKAMANRKTTAKELANNGKQVKVWEERAGLAVSEGDDDLARKALARKREYEKIVAALGDQHEAAQEASEGLRRQLEGMQAKLAEAKRRLGTLTARKKAADVRSKIAQTDLNIELDDNAFAKFDRLSQRVEQAEAEAEALAELATGERALNKPEPGPETEASATDLEIEAELVELKRKAKSVR